MQTCAIETADGCFLAQFSTVGLARIYFPDSPPENNRTQDTGHPDLAEEWLEVTTRALKDVLAGRIPETLPPYDLSVGTPFQRQVWNALCSIPAGQTLSYGEIATLIGAPKAVRAVGGACGANPIPVLIPCHRVLAKNQRIGGFSGGLHWKRLLLDREALSSFTLAKNSKHLAA